MASPPTSEHLWSFINDAGEPIRQPDEWAPAFIDIDVSADAWQQVGARIQGVAADPQVRRIGDRPRVVVPWERSPAGRYRVDVSAANARCAREITVAPTKITQDELEGMVTELESQLAPTIALSLQRMGAFAGLSINPPGESTLAAEMHRARTAVIGDQVHRGLVALLPEIGRDPHRMLSTNEPWVKTERARRPSPVRLATAMAKLDNLDSSALPRSVADRRVEHTFDVYENRILKLFVSGLEHRLRRLRAIAADLGKADIAEEADLLRRQLRDAGRSTPFLSEVTRPTHGPRQVSMVLYRRPDYRAMLAAYQRYRRHMTVALEDRTLDAPLADVPGLYELWGTMKVAEALVEVAEDLGFRVERNELVRRRGGDLRLVSRGAVVRLFHQETGTSVTFREQRAYSTGHSGLRSISYRQIPDMAIEVARPNSVVDVYLFDPKYKLRLATMSIDESEDGETEVFTGGPTKVDIDKMHAYRDAIRRPDGSPAVAYAAILYPGESRTFTAGLEAVQCRPNQSQQLEAKLHTTLSRWLVGSSATPNRKPRVIG